MAKLYELAQEPNQPELTKSLAHSLRNGLLIPVETKFKTLESNIALLQNAMNSDVEKVMTEANEKFAKLEAELVIVKKFFRICSALSLVTVLGIVTTLIVLFTWY
ncbi:hypothetical protein SAMN05660649_02692 [Desulfotomaculum arcticum]|uniref:Uncharacterized protein n=1 Tax=Desulfotruncus arcticus DSM 17038 TaxID=1121424 RepID=A0A1I2ULU3_9FIRM|nr:hypothetical protein [Desulfotruncus arcticus]SFG78020.1 hypothetical protein SAMN05660649_02692 [Desulfotomaculum arcticum] [Desulfotruncus arcticus DSM 17038]